MLDSIPIATDLFDKVPPFCTRCRQVPPVIRARHVDSNHKEYICMECKHADKALRNVPIKRKPASQTNVPNVPNVPKQTDKIPSHCIRCQQTAPKIRVHFRDYGFCDYICYDCKESDAFLRTLPVRPKERGFEFSSLFKKFSESTEIKNFWNFSNDFIRV